MIDRFNFYDVFGYFIPGSVLLIAIWIPIGLTSHEWPSADLASAIGAVVAAYLIGHFLQAVATRAVPSTKAGRIRSTAMLDSDSKALSKTLRDQVIAAARDKLGIALDKGESETQDDTDDRRGVAFLAAREQLVAVDRARYLEQFQALYSMMRGNLAACVIGVFYCLGWVASRPSVALLGLWLTLVAALALLITLIVPASDAATLRERQVVDQRSGRWIVIALCALAFVAGLLAGANFIENANQRFAIVGLALAFAALGLQSARSYDLYADQFARAVYRGFVQIHQHPLPKKPD